MYFKVGEKVVYLNERGGGVVVDMRGEYFMVEDSETGFSRRFQKFELAPVYSEQYDNHMPSAEVEHDADEDHSYLTKSKVSGKRKPEEVWEIDLHVEELVDSHANLTNTEILRKQMSALKTTIKDARKKHVPRLIAIHGVGEGVLKSELTNYLAQQDGVEYFDADFREYGKGATEIRLFNLD
jgi:hypothetical protein